MGVDVTRPLRTQREPDRFGRIVKRSPLDEATPYEQRERVAADHRGLPYLVYRDGGGRQGLVPLDREKLIVGRAPEADLVLHWDRGISRRHFMLEHTSDGWLLLDDGQSLNGTLINGEPISGSRLLHDRDLIQAGETGVAFRDPSH